MPVWFRLNTCIYLAPVLMGLLVKGRSSLIPRLSSQDNEKRTPLHAAAYLGDSEIIELLIMSGVSLGR